MRVSLSILTLFRSFARTVLTFVLMGVVTFTFFARVAEYAVATREMNNAERRYRGVGAVEVEETGSGFADMPVYLYADPRLEGAYSFSGENTGVERYRPLNREQIDAVAGLPFVSSVNTRYMTAGVSETYRRLPDGNSGQNVYYYEYMQHTVFEATLTEVWYAKPSENGGYGGPGSLNRLIVEDISFLTSFAPGFRPMNMWSIFGDSTPRYMLYAGPRMYPELGYLRTMAGIDTSSEDEYTDYLFGDEFLESLRPGSRYVFVALPNMQGDPFLGNFFTDNWCSPVRSIDGAPDNYIDTEEFSDLRELLEITENDKRTFDMVYTDDMGAILRFAEGNMAIIEGRALDMDDNERGAQVCVVYKGFAEAFGLGVGDTFTLRLGTELFEQFKGLGALSVTRERYGPVTEPVSLEIVGICRNIDTDPDQFMKPHWAYSVNTIFVPKSLLPVDESSLAGHEFSPAEVSFTVNDTRNFEAFIQETAPLIEGMGLTLFFTDAGWPEVVEAFNEAMGMSVLNIAVFTVAVSAATLFAVYLFIGRKKKEFAIMRALGTTMRVSGRALLIPLMIVAAVSILAGTVAASVYTAANIGQNEALLALRGYSANTTVPAWVVVVCVFGQLALTLVFALALLRYLGAKPPLALLYDGGGARRPLAAGRGAGVVHQGVMGAPIVESLGDVGEDSSPAAQNDTATGASAAANGRRSLDDVGDAGQDSSPAAQKDTAPGAARAVLFVLRYTMRHARRSAGKSVLAAVLAALLLGAVGQLAVVKQSYKDLVATTEIKANFAGGLPLMAMHMIKNNSFVSDSYYASHLYRVGADLSVAELLATNDIERYTGEAADIQFIDGYDMSCFDRAGVVIVAGKVFMEMYGYAPGDEVVITNENLLEYNKGRYLTRYRRANPDDADTDSVVLEKTFDQFKEFIKNSSKVHKIVGVLSTPSGEYDTILFTPGEQNATWGLLVAELTLSDNSRLDDFQAYGENIANSTGRVNFVIDSSKIEGPQKTLGLLESLYPGALAAALLIGAFVCCLMLLQSSKEAAIMRVLGTTKSRARAMLALGQVLPNIVGLAIGACALRLYNGSSMATESAESSVYAGLYIAVVLAAAFVCAAIVTRRRLLELLQDKE